MTKIAVIAGPTASGKTRLAVELALALGGEVVSADSMQIYKGMDIGTAKPTAAEMRGVKHHMIDVAEPDENWSAALWAEKAAECVYDISARGLLPIVAGGTGLYIDALISGGGFAGGGADAELRARLEAQYDREGGEAMLRLLAQKDPESAQKLHPNDKKRVVRALEVNIQTGKTISEHNRESKAVPPRFEAATIILDFEEREALYRRIDRRVDEMLAAGLEEEVRTLLEKGIVPEKYTSMQAIGYKEIAAALCGECGMAEAVENIKRETRRYAKRQLTWFRRDKNALRILWKNEPDFESALRVSTGFLADFGIIKPTNI